jgi:hypothetical protein
MGIKGLKSFLQNIDEIDGISTKNLNYYSGNTLGVDLSILLHRSIYNNSNYISYFVNFILKLIKHNIRPIFIFDGKPPKEKNGVLELRKKNKEKSSKKALSLLELKNKINVIYKIVKSSDVLYQNNNNDNNIYAKLTHRDIIENINLHLELLTKCKHDNYLNNNKNKELGFEINNNLNNQTLSHDLENEIANLNDKETTTEKGNINIESNKENNIETNKGNNKGNKELNYFGENNEYSKHYLDTILLEMDQSSVNKETALDIISNDIEKHNCKSKGVKKQYIENLKILFNKLHIPYIHLDREADCICKLLLDYQIIDGCVSDDMDMIPYKCQKIIQNINFSNDTIVEYDYHKIIKALNLNEEQMTDLCICCGTDFNNKLINIKCKEIYNLIKIYGSIEGILMNINKINDDRNKLLRIPYQFEYKNSRYLFLMDENEEFSKDNIINNIKNYKLPNIQNVSENISPYYNQIFQFLEKNIPEWTTNEINLKINKLLVHFLRNNGNYNKYFEIFNMNHNFKKDSNFNPNKSYHYKSNPNKLNTKYTKKNPKYFQNDNIIDNHLNKSKLSNTNKDEDDWQLVK